ncbi:MAG TPA: Spy/CpxP family protein refolding chaperone [Rhodopila sp.]|uniref:Spy/CpxP family protein refolding chaperone n=1 Tax=Rhodopila sp. TaxID=2480087 RepID=UPI002BC7B125|nr:Spy/CpxP family protein refolding chaperone [Rhodopila sp.]HVY15799.1 Spy/CpxP family protein refolding chaperone [Rhodopila sp.]
MTIRALLIASALVAGPAASFAQTTPSAGLSGEDQGTHHPENPQSGSTAPGVPAGMPRGMMGQQGQGGMMSGAMHQTMFGQAGEDGSAHHPEAGAADPSAGAPCQSAPCQGAPIGMMGQRGQGGMMFGDMHRMMSMMRGMMTMMSAQSGMMTSNVEGRIASLRSELGITEAQAPQWNRFADALRATAKSMNGMYGRMMHATDATVLPARLEAQVTALSDHLASLKALKEALDPLYASFSDDQKKRADRLMIGPMGMM